MHCMFHILLHQYEFVDLYILYHIYDTYAFFYTNRHYLRLFNKDTVYTE